jgi:hypothetical protein
VGFVCFEVAIKMCGLQAQTNTGAHRLIPKQLQAILAWRQVPTTMSRPKETMTI